MLSLKNSKNFEIHILKVFIPMLMNGTREKDATVRLRSEEAIINMLHLKENEQLFKVNNFCNQFKFKFNSFLLFKQCLETMDVIKETFSDCVKGLSKESYKTNISIDKCLLDETLIRLD